MYYFLVFLWFITCICFLICLSVIKKRKKENKDYRGAKMGAYVFLFAAILLFIAYSVIGNSQEENRNVPQYTIFHTTEDEKAIYVKTEEVTKETAKEIVRDLYARYGENLMHISIYDADQHITHGKIPDYHPKAEYYKAGDMITVYTNEGAESFTLK